MYGAMLVIFGIIIHSLVVYAIGLALFVDELAFLLLRGKTHADNYSWQSLVGTTLFVVLVFLAREYLVLPFT